MSTMGDENLQSISGPPPPNEGGSEGSFLLPTLEPLQLEKDEGPRAPFNTAAESDINSDGLSDDVKAIVLDAAEGDKDQTVNKLSDAPLDNETVITVKIAPNLESEKIEVKLDESTCFKWCKQMHSCKIDDEMLRYSLPVRLSNLGFFKRHRCDDVPKNEHESILSWLKNGPNKHDENETWQEYLVYLKKQGIASVLANSLYKLESLEDRPQALEDALEFLLRAMGRGHCENELDSLLRSKEVHEQKLEKLKVENDLLKRSLDKYIPTDFSIEEIGPMFYLSRYDDPNVPFPDKMGDESGSCTGHKAMIFNVASGQPARTNNKNSSLVPAKDQRIKSADKDNNRSSALYSDADGRILEEEELEVMLKDIGSMLDNGLSDFVGESEVEDLTELEADYVTDTEVEDMTEIIDLTSENLGKPKLEKRLDDVTDETENESQKECPEVKYTKKPITRLRTRTFTKQGISPEIQTSVTAAPGKGNLQKLPSLTDSDWTADLDMEEAHQRFYTQFSLDKLDEQMSAMGIDINVDLVELMKAEMNQRVLQQPEDEQGRKGSIKPKRKSTIPTENAIEIPLDKDKKTKTKGNGKDKSKPKDIDSDMDEKPVTIKKKKKAKKHTAIDSEIESEKPASSKLLRKSVHSGDTPDSKSIVEQKTGTSKKKASVVAEDDPSSIFRNTQASSDGHSCSGAVDLSFFTEWGLQPSPALPETLKMIDQIWGSLNSRDAKLQH